MSFGMQMILFRPHFLVPVIFAGYAEPTHRFAQGPSLHLTPEVGMQLHSLFIFNSAFGSNLFQFQSEKCGRSATEP